MPPYLGPGSGVHASGQPSDEAHVPVILKGGPYGETGKLVSIHPGATRRIVHIAEPEDRLSPGRKAQVHEIHFVPTHDKPPPGVHAVWRPTGKGSRTVSN